MSIQPNLRDVDRRRCTQFLAAWTCDDTEAVDAVLAEAVADRGPGVAGLLFAVAHYADWVAANTGPLTDPPPGHNGLGLT